jgi:glutaredoxin 3
MENTIIIYSTPICPYCVRAKDLLKKEGLPYQEIDVSSDQNLRAKMTELSGGRTSVPQIFINSTHVGGCDDLFAAKASGKLALLLK